MLEAKAVRREAGYPNSAYPVVEWRKRRMQTLPPYLRKVSAVGPLATLVAERVQVKERTRQRERQTMRRCRLRTSQVSIRGVHGWQAIQFCPSQQPAIPTKKKEMRGRRHPACKQEQGVQWMAHAPCQRLSGFARASQASAQPSRGVALLLREPGSESV